MFKPNSERMEPYIASKAKLQLLQQQYLPEFRLVNYHSSVQRILFRFHLSIAFLLLRFFCSDKNKPTMVGIALISVVFFYGLLILRNVDRAGAADIQATEAKAAKESL